jgi:hypothetical protein
MHDETKLRELILQAAAERAPDTDIRAQLREVIAGRQSLRQFAAVTAIFDRYSECFVEAVGRYRQHGDQDGSAVRRAFDPDAPKDLEGTTDGHA